MLIALFKRLLADERGTSAVEMGLICVLIVIAILSAVQGFASGSQKMWTDISTSSQNAVNASS